MSDVLDRWTNAFDAFAGVDDGVDAVERSPLAAGLVHIS